MKFNTKKLSLLLSILALTTLTACSQNAEDSKTSGPIREVQENVAEENTNNTIHEVQESTEQAPEKDSPLDLLNQLATLSKSTEEIYVTDDFIVGEDEDINPGIYDLEITGGSGNIFGDRADVHSLYINWVGWAEGVEDYPSKIRIILFEGDVLELSNISKVKFNAVPEKVEPSNELGIGEFIVGRDIVAGDYKLSTNATLDPEYDNLGWDISIYNDNDGKSRDQSLTATNNDVVIRLKDGEIVSTDFYNTDRDSSTDDARLIFSEF